MKKKSIRKYKKIKSFLIGAVMILGLSACGSQDMPEAQTAKEDTTQTPEEITQAPEEDTTSEPALDTTQQADEGLADEESKVLVVYYSASGNTEKIANYIAAATDADMFKLEPAKPYSSDDLDWTDENSRVVYEHDNPEARDIALVETSVENWESYDTVFIGYPIWWHIAAWPVDGFVTANDFTGKTVIPFCTSSSSGLGDSGSLLEEEAGTGNWLEGNRFSARDSEATVQEWVESLGLQTADAIQETGKSSVYFTSDISPDGLMAVYEALNWEPTGKVAVKLSTGEPPASNYLNPELIKDLVQSVDGTIVECNTAYGGSRTETAMHMQVAEDHGFTDIATVDILDADGSMELPVTGGTHLTGNLVGSHFAGYDSYIVLSHFKGHAMAGFGGAIKNISIGLGSKEGQWGTHYLYQCPEQYFY